MCWFVWLSGSCFPAWFNILIFWAEQTESFLSFLILANVSNFGFAWLDLHFLTWLLFLNLFSGQTFPVFWMILTCRFMFCFSGVPPQQIDSAQEALDQSAMNASIVALDYSFNDDEYDRILKGENCQLLQGREERGDWFHMDLLPQGNNWSNWMGKQSQMASKQSFSRSMEENHHKNRLWLGRGDRFHLK